MKCKDCKYWDADPHAGEGYCHRYPPAPQDATKEGFRNMYSLSCSEDWCGEFAKTDKPLFYAFMADLSVRASNVLRKMRVRNIQELNSLEDSELLDMRNFGRNSLREVRNLALKYKSRLENSHVEEESQKEGQQENQASQNNRH